MNDLQQSRKKAPGLVMAKRFGEMLTAQTAHSGPRGWFTSSNGVHVWQIVTQTMGRKGRGSRCARRLFGGVQREACVLHL